MGLKHGAVKQIRMAAEQGLTQAETSRLLDMEQSLLYRTRKKFGIEFITEQEKRANERRNEYAKEIERQRGVSSNEPTCEDEQIDARGHGTQGASDKDEFSLLPEGATSIDRVDTDAIEASPKNIRQLADLLSNEDKENHYEIIYAYKLASFEKAQIKAKRRPPISRGSRQSCAHSTANRQPVKVTRPYDQYKQERILKAVNRGGEYTTSMIARSVGYSVSFVAPQLNIMFNAGMVSRANVLVTAFIGSGESLSRGKRSWRWVYYKKD